MNILIKDAKVLVYEDTKFVVKKADIAIAGEKIAQIEKIITDFEAQKVINAEDMLAMPGLINAHTHLSMNLFRN
ncbi:MAG TPA: N-ethylammeline chlorohydrolase, partial [Thermoanaerobacterales bacterium]|nr:N-ethylammeline chlorohydrolase [Thermoanaerobacterales bacterium]